MSDEKETGISPAALGAIARGDFDNFVVASTPGGIERQEKEGQTALVNSTLMPLDLVGKHPREGARKDFESLGFVFGEPVDSVFVNTTMPPGWTRQATDHDMWSHILDEKGRVRVKVFYKAAFYDRHADARLTCRYTRTTQYKTSPSDGFGEDEQRAVVLDGDKAIYQGPIIQGFGLGNKLNQLEKAACFDRIDAQDKLAKDWLFKHFPDADNPLAYWDAP